MNRDELYQCDLRRTASHEVGHAVVALSLCPGATASVRIWPTGANDSADKLLGGCCQFQFPRPLPAQARAVIAVAGLVAENMEDDLIDLVDLADDALSPTDGDLAGNLTPAQLGRAVWRARSILASHASELAALSAALCAQSLAAPDGWGWLYVRRERGRIVAIADGKPVAVSVPAKFHL